MSATPLYLSAINTCAPQVDCALPGNRHDVLTRMQVGDQEVSTQQKALQATALRRVCDCAELIMAAAQKMQLGTNKNHWSARPAGCEDHTSCVGPSC